MSGGPPPAFAAGRRVPRGELRRARVVEDLAAPLADALADRLTGYLRVEPSEALLGGGGEASVLTLEAGVPVLAYDAGTDAGGPAALAALAGAAPARVETYRVPAAALADLHEDRACRVAPAAPARELAGDDALAERTRAAAPADREPDPERPDALAAFLADEARVEAVQAEARAEARARAREWGFDTVDETGGGSAEEESADAVVGTEADAVDASDTDAAAASDAGAGPDDAAG